MGDDSYSSTIIYRTLETQKVMNKHMSECLYGDHEINVPTLKEKIITFFSEARNRTSNAYDCLVKGVDPYDGY